jgi:tetratricopeptide (TPR) repeat protein
MTSAKHAASDQDGSREDESALDEGDLVTATRNIAGPKTLRASGDLRRFASASLRQADVARSAGDSPGAERYLREALSMFIVLDDRFSAARALSMIADLRYLDGDYLAAADLNRQAVERMPGDVQALTGLAYAQWRAGSPADAEATFNEVLRWDSQVALALAGRGQIRADLGRYQYALDDLDQALALQLAREAETDARSARALALAGLGRAPEAHHELAITLERDPKRSRSRLRAGRIAAILGEEDKIRNEIELALSGQPTLSSTEREAARRVLLALKADTPSA